MQRCLNQLRQLTLEDLTILVKTQKDWGFAWTNLITQAIEEKKAIRR